MRLVIIYHDPGERVGHELVKSLAEKVRVSAGVEVGVAPVSLVEEGRAPISKGDMVFALLPFRGGHLKTVEEACAAAGSRFLGKIPNSIIAEAVASRATGCDSITLLYWRAKRFVEEQEEDLEEIMAAIASKTGARVTKAVDCSGRCTGCIAVTSLMPGRLTREAHGSGGRVIVGYLLEAVEDYIVAWLRGRITGA